MSYLRWLALPAIAATSFAFAAHDKQHTDPTDPAALIVPTTYRSAFEQYRPQQDEYPPPDTAWRAANQEMEKLKGHVGHMQQDAGARVPQEQHKHH
ncbi:MAG: hypothetical protein ACREX0_16625 [Noviherbaspirillum sp.]